MYLSQGVFQDFAQEGANTYRTLAKEGPWAVHLNYVGPRLGGGLIFEVSVSQIYAKERPGKLLRDLHNSNSSRSYYDFSVIQARLPKAKEITKFLDKFDIFYETCSSL